MTPGMAPAPLREWNVALAAVTKAMRVCGAVQAKLVTADTLTKKDKSPVTVADFASQAVVCAAIAQAFPDDPIVGEETAGELRQPDAKPLRDAVVLAARREMAGACESDILSAIDRGGADGAADRYWTLDPIDGTKGFLRGGQYAVALALIVNHQVVFGVLGCPNVESLGEKGTIFLATRGGGARFVTPSGMNPDRIMAPGIRVRNITDTADARFCESVESGHSDQSLSQRIATSLGITAPPLRMDSQVKYGILARGDASIYLRLPTRADYREKIWDHAAGAIIVEEAGGKVTDLHGRPLDFSQGRTLANNQGIIATSGAIHDEVVAAVKAAIS